MIELPDRLLIELEVLGGALHDLAQLDLLFKCFDDLVLYLEFESGLIVLDEL